MCITLDGEVKGGDILAVTQMKWGVQSLQVSGRPVFQAEGTASKLKVGLVCLRNGK